MSLLWKKIELCLETDITLACFFSQVDVVAAAAVVTAIVADAIRRQLLKT